MENLWLLTEERPKPSVILQIIEIYCNDFDDKITLKEEIRIKPIIENGVFKFIYVIEGLKVDGANSIYIKSRRLAEVLVFLIFSYLSKNTLRKKVAPLTT